MIAKIWADKGTREDLRFSLEQLTQSEHLLETSINDWLKLVASDDDDTIELCRTRLLARALTDDDLLEHLERFVDDPAFRLVQTATAVASESANKKPFDEFLPPSEVKSITVTGADGKEQLQEVASEHLLRDVIPKPVDEADIDALLAKYQQTRTKLEAAHDGKWPLSTHTWLMFVANTDVTIQEEFSDASGKHVFEKTWPAGQPAFCSVAALSQLLQQVEHLGRGALAMLSHFATAILAWAHDNSNPTRVGTTYREAAAASLHGLELELERFLGSLSSDQVTAAIFWRCYDTLPVGAPATTDHRDLHSNPDGMRQIMMELVQQDAASGDIAAIVVCPDAKTSASLLSGEFRGSTDISRRFAQPDEDSAALSQRQESGEANVRTTALSFRLLPKDFPSLWLYHFSYIARFATHDRTAIRHAVTALTVFATGTHLLREFQQRGKLRLLSWNGGSRAVLEGLRMSEVHALSAVKDELLIAMREVGLDGNVIGQVMGVVDAAKDGHCVREQLDEAEIGANTVKHVLRTRESVPLPAALARVFADLNSVDCVHEALLSGGSSDAKRLYDIAVMQLAHGLRQVAGLERSIVSAAASLAMTEYQDASALSRMALRELQRLSCRLGQTLEILATARAKNITTQRVSADSDDTVDPRVCGALQALSDAKLAYVSCHLGGRWKNGVIDEIVTTAQSQNITAAQTSAKADVTVDPQDRDALQALSNAELAFVSMHLGGRWTDGVIDEIVTTALSQNIAMAQFSTNPSDTVDPRNREELENLTASQRAFVSLQLGDRYRDGVIDSIVAMARSKSITTVQFSASPSDTVDPQDRGALESLTTSQRHRTLQWVHGNVGARHGVSIRVGVAASQLDISQDEAANLSWVEMQGAHRRTHRESMSGGAPLTAGQPILMRLGGTARDDVVAKLRAVFTPKQRLQFRFGSATGKRDVDDTHVEAVARELDSLTDPERAPTAEEVQQAVQRILTLVNGLNSQQQASQGWRRQGTELKSHAVAAETFRQEMEFDLAKSTLFRIANLKTLADARREFPDETKDVDDANLLNAFENFLWGDVPNTKAVLELLGPHFTTKNDLCDLFKQRWTFRDAGEDKKLTSWKKFAKWARSCSPDKLQLKISTTDLASDSFQFFKKASGGQSQPAASSTEAPVRPALH